MKKRLFGGLTVIVAVVMGVCFMASAAEKEMTADDFIAECGDRIKNISLEEAKKIHEKGEAIFLDCRTEKEFKAGAISNAVSMERGLIEVQIAQKIPDKNAKIVVYCKSGKRSSLSACTLSKMGYKNVLNMNAGWDAWVKAGYPVN